MIEHREDQSAPHEQNVEVSEHGVLLAAAKVTTSTGPHGTAHATFHAEAGHLPPGARRELVDAVLDLPEVLGSDHLQASVPIGDAESLDRLRQRTSQMRTHAAGCTALIDAELCACGN